jgi:hypothetical protein
MREWLKRVVLKTTVRVLILDYKHLDSNALDYSNVLEIREL